MNKMLSLNFLDLSKINNGIAYKINRKPTTTDNTIDATYSLPQSHKMAAYISFVNRLFKVSMS